MHSCYDITSNGFTIGGTQVSIGDIIYLKDREKEKEGTFKLTKYNNDSFELTKIDTTKQPIATICLYKYSEKETLWKLKRTDHRIIFERYKKDPHIMKLILNDNDVYYF